METVKEAIESCISAEMNQALTLLPSEEEIKKHASLYMQIRLQDLMASEQVFSKQTGRQSEHMSF